MKIYLYVLFVLLLSNYIKCDDESHNDDDHHDHRPDDPDISTSHSHYDKEGSHDESFDHDAVTGSHHDTEEFKDLEPEEAKKRLGLLYDKMDLDKNQKLTKNELFQWIIQSFKNLDRENSEHKMEEFDENRDKSVSFDEYVNKIYGHNEKELEDMWKNNETEMHSFLNGAKLDKLRFELADRDKNGLLNLDEFTHFMHPQNYPNMAEYELKRTLEDFDKNHDGVLDLKEFMGDDKLSPETAEHEKESFKEHDKNKNGHLDKDEIIEWAMPGFDKTAHSEVEHLFNETDTNKDKTLTKDEVIAQHELWTGSQATDYGKHLDDMKSRDEL